MHTPVKTWLGVTIIIIMALSAGMFIWYQQKNLAVNDQPVINYPARNHKACTEEVKICPDGSVVGITGSNCEFELCPGECFQKEEFCCLPNDRCIGMPDMNCMEDYQPIFLGCDRSCQPKAACEPIFDAGEEPRASGGCKIGGCSGEICDEEDFERMVSICLWKPKYECSKFSRCERQSNNKCGWTETEEFLKCNKRVKF